MGLIVEGSGCVVDVRGFEGAGLMDFDPEKVRHRMSSMCTKASAIVPISAKSGVCI